MLLTLLSIVVAQARPGQPGGGDAAGGCGVMLLSCGCPLLVFLVVLVPMFAGMWKSFAKAGEPGWAAIVPIYNVMTICKIAGKEDFNIRWLFWMIPIAGIYFSIVDTVDFCKAYAREAGFAIGMVLLPYIFWPILGFGSAKYIGAPTGGSVRRSARRYEDEDEGDVPPPRPRRRRTEEDY